MGNRVIGTYLYNQAIDKGLIGGYTEIQENDYVPVMNSNTQDGFIASGSNTLGGTDDAWLAFHPSVEGGTDYTWHSPYLGSKGWVYTQIHIPDSIIVNGITIGARKNWSGGGQNARPIYGFKLEGSDDGINRTEIHSETALSWTRGEVKDWSITGQTTAYTWLKLNIQSTNSYVAFDFWNVDGVVSEGRRINDSFLGELSPQSINLNADTIGFTAAGQAQQLTATVLPDDAPRKDIITWTSSDSTIATVSSTGLVTCVTPGDCTITATTVNGLTATCSVIQSEYVYEEYTFSDGSPVQSGWTVTTQYGFKKGSLGSEWITAGRGSSRCEMTRDITGWQQFKIQWRCYAKFVTWGGRMDVYVGDGTTNSGATFNLSTYVTTFFAGFVDNVNLPEYLTTTTGHYIVEVNYSGGEFTAKLYGVNQDDEPGALIYQSATSASITSLTNLYLCHEHGDGYSETKWIKVWHG